MHLVTRLLEAHDANVVLDVGANSGRYAIELRRAGYSGRIVSFEPVDEPFTVLEARAAGDSLWDVLPFAIGAENGTTTLNVAANAGESSSILPMLSAHIDAAPAASYIGTQSAQIRTLDSLLPEILRPGDRAFLKADVQGYERSVLEGAASTLRDHCVGIQLEMSFVPLYEGGMLYREALDHADSLGFALMGFIPGFVDPRNSRMLQVDGVFFRERDDS
jgi:FkbM family methyltransferase